jgi:type 1 fimbriae regulatory protein FimB
MPEEVAKFLAAAKNKSLSRNPERDFCLLLLMVRHGLRVSEAINLRLSDVDLQAKVMHVKRLKNGVSTTHPLYNGEVKAIKDWMVKRQEMSLDALTLGAGNTLFISERRRPLERSNVCKMVNTFAKAAGLSELNVHPHMLRHSCGYDLANRGVDTRCIQGYLGHRNIQHTVRYTELSPTRFANLY